MKTTRPATPLIIRKINIHNADLTGNKIDHPRSQASRIIKKPAMLAVIPQRKTETETIRPLFASNKIKLVTNQRPTRYQLIQIRLSIHTPEPR